MSAVSTLQFQQAALERGSYRREDPDYLRQLVQGGEARVVVLTGGKAAVSGESLHYFPLTDVLRAGFAGREPGNLQNHGAEGSLIYLGKLEAAALPSGWEAGTRLLAGTDVAAVAVAKELADALAAGAAEPVEFRGYRELAPELGVVDAQCFIQAVAITNWHRVHTHCPRCGGPTQVRAAGWVRHCEADGSDHFPRTDPAIITTVVGADGRVLLGNNANWPRDRFSTLAGFVEPGESLEQAVAREVFEEVGVSVDGVTYLGSQSWPFPASLMLGFTATTAQTEFSTDEVEIAQARWFTREELQAAMDDGSVEISAKLSISRTLIEQWYGSPLKDREQH